MDVEISGQGVDAVDDLQALREWLDHESELRGLIRHCSAPPVAGELGAVSDVLVAAVSGGGVASVLAAALQTFFAQPRGSKVHIKLTLPSGRSVELDAERVKDVSDLLERLLQDDDQW